MASSVPCSARGPDSYGCSSDLPWTLALSAVDRWTTGHKWLMIAPAILRRGTRVSATAGSAAGQHGLIDKLGIDDGAVVQEIGWDDDCDEELRRVIRDKTGQDLVD